MILKCIISDGKEECRLIDRDYSDAVKEELVDKFQEGMRIAFIYPFSDKVKKVLKKSRRVVIKRPDGDTVGIFDVSNKVAKKLRKRCG